MSAYVCMDAWRCGPLTPEQLNGFYFPLGTDEFIRLRFASDECEHSRSKIRALHIGPKKQVGDFFNNGHYDFDQISVIHGHHLPE
jgi:hypothetical protein